MTTTTKRVDWTYGGLCSVGLLGVVLSFVFWDSALGDFGDCLAVFCGTWLIARSYYEKPC